jgi:hypothetical protein
MQWNIAQQLKKSKLLILTTMGVDLKHIILVREARLIKECLLHDSTYMKLKKGKLTYSDGNQDSTSSEG